MPYNCNKCEHYYITWEKSFPYGCRAMGFKSKKSPSATVRSNSGIECLKFKIKTNKKNKDRIQEPEDRSQKSEWC